MKIRTQYLIILVICFLVSLSLIQFVWIFKAAANQEKQFEFTVVAALNKAVTEFNKQNAVCLKVTNCFNEKGFTCCEKKHLEIEQWNFIDSIIKSELILSKISLTYEFQLSTEPHPHPAGKKEESKHKCFTIKSNLTTNANESIWLHISFPDRSKFVFAQIGWLFVMSMLLIILTIGAFILIYRYYLQEKMLANDTRNFINNLTHEFKTPLASIRLANSRIAKEPGCAVKLETYTSIIKQENDKLDLHINYLLDISRLQKGKMPMNFGQIDLHEQILKQTNSFKLLLDERNGKITLNLNAEKHYIIADCFHISNVLNNLIDNACKYSHLPPEITVSTFNKNGWIVLAVSDKGLGIEKTDQKIIFQEFSRVNTGNVHNVKGFGLGLSYVMQIVELHHGKLNLESKLGEGSTFFVELPWSE